MLTDDFIEIKLEAMKFAFQEWIPFESLANCKLDESKIIDQWGNRLLRRFVVYVLSRKVQTKVIQYPTTVWDHIKQDYFPQWLKDRYPPTYTIEKFEQIEIFPDLKMNGMHIMRHNVSTSNGVNDTDGY